MNKKFLKFISILVDVILSLVIAGVVFILACFKIENATFAVAVSIPTFLVCLGLFAGNWNEEL